MAIAALLLWMCTAAAGAYLLTGGARVVPREPAELASRPRSAAAGPAPEEPAAVPGAIRDRDRFDPPSLIRAKSEPIPGLRALAEFTHPALAIVGFGFWAGYVLTRDRVFAAIGFGILLGAICAGLSWFTANARAGRRQRPGSLTFSPRLLILHGAGAALTLLLTALIAARA